MEKRTGITRGTMVTRRGGAPVRVIVEIGEDADDRSGYAATAKAYTDFSAALIAFLRLKTDHPTTCMRYMYNDPELGFPPYWEVDQDAAAMEARIKGCPKWATLKALRAGGVSQEEALRLSGLWPGATTCQD